MVGWLPLLRSTEYILPGIQVSNRLLRPHPITALYSVLRTYGLDATKSDNHPPTE